MQTFDPDFDLLEDFPSVCMENSSKSAVHFDSSIKKCQRVNIKSGKRGRLGSCLPEGSPADRNHQRPFRVSEEHRGSEASAPIEVSGAATWSIENASGLLLICYCLYILAINREIGNLVIKYNGLSLFSCASQWCIGQGSCSIRVKLEKPQVQGDLLQLQ